MKAMELLEVFFKTIEHFYPKFNMEWLGKIPDPRNPNMITYKIQMLLLGGIFLFSFKLRSRRNLKFKLHNETFLATLSEWLKREGVLSEDEAKESKSFPHGDTLEYLLERLDPKYLGEILAKMNERLIRMRALEKYRLFNRYYTIAIDATWELRFNHEHCTQCLRMKVGEDREGQPKYIYYHPVLEAKLVTPNGLALSIATEFIENIIVNENDNFEKQKQDCELRAFYRLAPKIKKAFPQLNICLVLDGLYAGKPVFDICEKYNWKRIITFKEGSMPATYEEFETLKKLSPENYAYKEEENGTVQRFHWVNEIDYEGHKLNVLECRESTIEKSCRFVWLTDFTINSLTFEEIAKGGRIRWKIENEGFNMQKNGGYELEHAYSLNQTAIKNFYFLLQIAHILNQLMEKGSLLKEKLLKIFGSIKNFTAALYQAFISCVFHFNAGFFARRIQIRFSFDSS